MKPDGDWMLLNQLADSMSQVSIDVDANTHPMMVHCIVCSSVTAEDIPETKIISAHTTEASAKQLLQRLQTIADASYDLVIQSVPLEK